MFERKTLKRIAIPVMLLTAVSIGTFKVVHANNEGAANKKDSPAMVGPRDSAHNPAQKETPKSNDIKSEPKMSLEPDSKMGNCLNLSFDSTFYPGGVINVIDREDNIAIAYDLTINKADGNNPEYRVPLDEMLDKSPSKTVVTLITLVKNTKDANGDDGLQAGLEIHKEGNELKYRALTTQETSQYFEELKKSFGMEEKHISPTV